MNLCIIGTGYVGLVTGAVMADLGNDVICVDNDASKISMLQDGHMPIYEPGLDEIVERNVNICRLSFVTDIEFAVRRADAIFVAVGTPLGVNGYADLSAVRQVAQTIGRNLQRHTIIVNKSTVPVGTADMVQEIIKKSAKHPDATFDVVSNPEFLREGNAVYDTLHPDRIVIGANNPQAAKRIAELYASLNAPIILTDTRSAEVTKYASNAFLAAKISFSNAIACICEVAGADITQVVKGMGYDKRIGPEFLNAGLGYGGSCFGKDTQCLISTADQLGYDFSLLKAVVDVNEEQPKRFIENMRTVMNGFDGGTVAILGLAFKPDTDDLRDAKSLEIIGKLLAEGAKIRAYDPIAMVGAQRVFPQVEYYESAYEAVDGADAAVVVTEWNEIKSLDLARVHTLMARPLIFDGRNIYNPAEMSRLGFEYHSIGRPSAPHHSLALHKPVTTTT